MYYAIDKIYREVQSFYKPTHRFYRFYIYICPFKKR